MSDARSADRRPAWWAWLFWLGSVAILCAIPALRPDARTASSLYELTTRAWWQQQDLPAFDVAGLPGLPQLAILYTPFALGVPAPWGVIVWRAASGLMLAGAAMGLARIAGGLRWPRVFLGTTALALPAAIPAILDAQAIVPAAALLGFAAVALADARWGRAAAFLALAAALAPSAIVACVVVALLHPRQMSWRVGVAMLAVLMIPFVAQPRIGELSPDYVLRQYDLAGRDFVALARAQTPPPADAVALLRRAGVAMSEAEAWVARAAAGAVLTTMAWATLWRWGRARGWAPALGLLALALSLANPWARGVDFLPVALAWAAVAAGASVRDGRPIMGVALAIPTLARGPAAWGQPPWLGAAAGTLLLPPALWLVLRFPPTAEPAAESEASAPAASSPPPTNVAP